MKYWGILDIKAQTALLQYHHAQDKRDLIPCFYCLAMTHRGGTSDSEPLAPSLIRPSVGDCGTATIILFSPAGVGIRITLFSLEHGHGMRYTERIDM